MIDPQKPDFDATPARRLRGAFTYLPGDAGAKPIISIITPFYNTGEVFRETAETVLRQSLQQWEWLIINDGSEELLSLEILESYRKSDPRIHVIDHPSNLGLSSARNTGIRESQTDYCLFLDSDDLLEPTAAEKWFWFLESQPEYAFVHGYSVCFGASQYLWSSGLIDEEANLERNRISFVLLARKAVCQELGGFDESIRGGLEDWEFWFRCAARGYWGTTIQEYLLWVRTRPMHTDRWENLSEASLETYRQGFHEKYPQLWSGGFPKIRPAIDLDIEELTEQLPLENRLEKAHPRLLIIAPWLVMGGAERFNLDLMRQLVKSGWEITLAATAPSDHPWQHWFEEITPDVFAMARFLDWKDYPRFLMYLIRSRQIDLILIASSTEGYRLLPTLRFYFPDLPVLDYLHFVTPDWMNGGIPRLSLIYRKMLDFSIVASGSLKRWMVNQGVPESQLEVCTINVDTEFWRPDPKKRQILREQLGIQVDQTLILYVARLEPQKRPQIFIETMLRLQQQGLLFHALVIGAGSQMEALEVFIRENQLQDQVQCLGNLSSAAVRDWMAAGDILFLPSENEGISATFYEAMACGLALVGSDVGGQSELVTPECGVLLPVAEKEPQVEAYAGVLATLIENPALRKEMGLAGRARVVEKFPLDRLGENILSIFDRVSSLKRNQSQKLELYDFVTTGAGHAVAYLRARDEVRKSQKRLDDLHIDALRKELADLELAYTKLKFDPPMPAAPASTYFYFFLRRLFLPLHTFLTGLLSGSEWISRRKDSIKRLFVK